MTSAFRCRVDEFDASNALEKLGRLIAAASSSGFSTHYLKQTDAWQKELDIIGEATHDLIRLVPDSVSWHLFFEFEIPRRGKRPDVVLLGDDLIFVIEFKIGATEFESSACWQATSYALDIRDFHLGSEGRRIAPLLVATSACSDNPVCVTDNRSPVLPLVRVPGENAPLAETIYRIYRLCHDPDATPIDADAWERAPYRPAPTIVEAAQQLFAGHGVANISHAFATNLRVTSTALVKAIRRAQAEGRRVVCFVTGIPGAGKTLAGLNAVHDPEMQNEGRPAAVFLSGNGPLVNIVREALIRDRQEAGARRNEAARTVATFIDNVHRFIATYGLERTDEPPYENAIVFDEAQRAWDAGAVAKKHSVRKSEAELVLDIMERAPGWSVVIALVGGGQEIHTGEAGLEEWGRAIGNRSIPWDVFAPPDAMTGGDSVAGHRLFEIEPPAHITVHRAPEFHLDVSVRSPRARRIGEWVNGLLAGSRSSANVNADTSSEFPIVLTRNLNEARDWLSTHADGDQRCGLLASSGALRLRAEGIEVSSGFRRAYSYEDWFLSGANDSRSSSWLEVAATEFECQGLELDWTGICWGGDFMWDNKRKCWGYRRFRGTHWQFVRQPHEKQYIANKYRVLLTRARRGMVIYVPRGDGIDQTRDAKALDSTADYLAMIGIATR